MDQPDSEIYLYDGEVRMYLQGRGHTYWVNRVDSDKDVQVPSVTQILSVINKPALLPWAVKETVEYLKSKLEPDKTYSGEELRAHFLQASLSHIYKKEAAANIGTEVHEWIDDYIHEGKKEMPQDEKIRQSIGLFLDWVAKNQVQFILAEHMVYSKKHNFCGKLDFTAKIGGKLWMGDTKTSNGIYETYHLQLAAYQLARTEEHPEEEYSGQIIVRIGKDGSFEFKPIYEYERNKEIFIAARNLHKGLEEMRGVNSYHVAV